MSQIQSINWKDGVNSFSLNQMFLGIVAPGRYCGYDNMASVSGLTFTLNHSTTGIVKTNISIGLTNKTGVMVTQQGLVIQEDDVIGTLTCNTNTSNLSIRNDLVVIQHQKVNSPGGTAAIYLVIEGPHNSTALPTLPLPNIQTVVGIMSIPASASDLSGATWIKSPVPSLGNNTDLFTNYPQLKNTFGQLSLPNNWTGINSYPTYGTWGATSGKYTPNTSQGPIVSNSATTTLNEIDKVAGAILYLTQSANNSIINLDATPAHGGLPIHCEAISKFGLTSISLSALDCVILICRNTYYEMICCDSILADVIQSNIDDITLLKNKVYANLTDPGSLQAITGATVDITGLSYTTPNDGITRKYLLVANIATSSNSGNYASDIILNVDGTTSGLGITDGGTSSPDTHSISIIIPSVGPNKVIKLQAGIGLGAAWIIGINGVRTFKVSIMEF